MFDGNNDSYTVVRHNLVPHIKARYIRFRPLKWEGRISMRVELYGCDHEGSSVALRVQSVF